MKKLIIASFFAICTAHTFAATPSFKIGDEYIVPNLETPKSLTVKLGQPSSTKGNKMVWQKGAAIITAEFKNAKLQELSSNLFSVPPYAKAPERKAEFTFITNVHLAANTGAFKNEPILKVGSSLKQGFCLAAHWIDKKERTLRYTVKKAGPDNGSFYWSSDTTQDAVDEWALYRKDTYTQGMGLITRVGWVNEPVKYDVKKCF